MAAFKFQDQAFLANTHRHGVTPASFPGLHRWYKADSYLPGGVDGQTVGGGTADLGEWIDQTGSGDDANHPTAGGTFRTNIVGTMPVIRQTVDFLNFLPGGLGDLTIMSAHRQISGGDTYIVAAPFIANHQVRRDMGGADATLFYAGVGVFADPLADPNDFMVMTVRRSAGVVSFRQNKVSRGGGAEAGLFTVNQIGNSATGGSIDHGELMIWTSVLSDANVDQLYDEYLKPRWTTLP